MKTLIGADNTIALWAVIIGFVCFAMYAERNYKWAKAVGATLICLVGGMIMPTINLVPTSAAVYDAIWDYVVPVAVPLVLFDADIRRIGKECGRLLIAFAFACCGTVCGAIVSSAIFQGGGIPEMHAAAAMFTGSQTGGSMNLLVASQMFDISDGMFDAVYLADTITFSITLFTLTMLPVIKFFQKFNGVKYPKLSAMTEEELDKMSSPSQSRTTNTFEIAKALALSFAIVMVSQFLAGWVNDHVTIGIIKSLFGQQYLLITLFTVLIATFFPKQVGGIVGSQHIGMFLMNIFFVAISIGADLKQIAIVGPRLIIFSFIIFCGIIVFSVLGGKLCKFSIEELCVAANSALGGPSTSAAFAAANGWKELVTPGVLMGVLGYIVGNYLALFVGNFVLKTFC